MGAEITTPATGATSVWLSGERRACVELISLAERLAAIADREPLMSEGKIERGERLLDAMHAARMILPRRSVPGALAEELYDTFATLQGVLMRMRWRELDSLTEEAA